MSLRSVLSTFVITPVLTAGLLAQRLGLPTAGFVAATNVNDVVPEYLATGEFRPRPSRATLSNAMDVGNPNNFVRLLHLYDGDLAALRRDVEGSSWSDDETRGAIRTVFEHSGYLLDPHTAVGYLGLRRRLETRSGETSGVVLATAHPIKFRQEVEPLIGQEIPLPARLAECLDRPRNVLPMEPREAALEAFLRQWEH